MGMATDFPSQRHDRSVLVIYGSETGNSEDIAEGLGRMMERMHFTTRVCEMDSIEINNLLKYAIVIFVISTTGQGEFPKNARKLWKSLLRKRLPPGCLHHVRMTTFGLGDSSYAQFNWAARKLHKRLEQLGAQEIYPRGEADEQHSEGIDGTYLSWSFDLGKHLLSLYPLANGISPIPADVLLPPKHFLKLAEDSTVNEIIFQTSPLPEKPPTPNDNLLSTTSLQATDATSVPLNLTNGLQTNGIPAGATFLTKSDDTMDHTALLELEPRTGPQIKEAIPGVSDPVDRQPHREYRNLPWPDSVPATLVGNKRITPKDHWQDVRELTFHMDHNTLYDPGDVLTIYPKNFPEDVQSLIDLMNWNDIADSRITFEAGAPKFFGAEDIPLKVKGLYTHPKATLRQLLTDNLDITAIPKRYFFEFVAHQTNNAEHKERLLEFSNPAHTDEFFDYATRPRRSILEILQDFPSVQIPFKWATSVFPLIRGRQYSISSGGKLKCARPDTGIVVVQLLVAIVKYRTVLKKIRQGLCSRYLASLPEDTPLRVLLSDGSFDFKSYQPNKPLILIGPGTGLAPLRSLIWQRAAIPSEHRAPCLLFFGNRNRNADFFYKDDWSPKFLGTRIRTAFSRDQKEKIFVQDLIRRDKKEVWKLIEAGAVVYVCGSSGGMPKAVREAITEVLEEFGPVNGRKGAEEKVTEMVRKGYYVQETW